MSLDYQNPNNSVNQIYPYQQQHPFAFQNPNHILLPSNETEFLSSDSFDQFYDPLFNPLPFDFGYDQNHINDDIIIPNNNTNNTPFDFIEHPPPMYFPKEEVLSVHEDYSAQFLNFPKKQRHENYMPDFNGDFMMNEQSNSNYYNYYNYNNNNIVDYGVFNDGYGYGETSNENIKVKGKEISAQSKAARERRRKIKEKTHALGKMIPGGNRMNTAQMFQAAFKYVKFMQAQLLILQSIKALKQDNSEKEGKKNYLSILSSRLIQEKLYAKEKCLVPMDFLPILEEHCDSEMKPLISQHMKDLFH